MSQTVAAFVAECLGTCENGFENEHAHRDWMKVRRARINKLPRPLRAKILFAYEQATAKEFSNGAQPAPEPPPEAKDRFYGYGDD